MAGNEPIGSFRKKLERLPGKVQCEEETGKDARPGGELEDRPRAGNDPAML
jgi:hypothetical protein